MQTNNYGQQYNNYEFIAAFEKKYIATKLKIPENTSKKLPLARFPKIDIIISEIEIGTNNETTPSVKFVDLLL